ncbi:MAG: hypothetical protein ACE5K0_04570 [Candidatus Methanofastidiosia archaeon]
MNIQINEKIVQTVIKLKREIDELYEELKILNDKELMESLSQAERGETTKFDSFEDFVKHFEEEDA